MSLPAAIDVLFSLNFSVAFDFMCFRFRPRKAKSIGNVLTNRQNAANCCFHREWKKSAEKLRIGILVLRQYIHATMHPAPIGNGVQICSVYNFQILFRGFFYVRRTSPNDAGWFGTSIGSARYKREKKNMRPAAAFSLFMGTSPINFGLLGGNGNTFK
jgi:hypothetical protein